MGYTQESCKFKSSFYVFYSTLILLTLSLFAGWFVLNEEDERKQSSQMHFTPTFPPSQIPSNKEQIQDVSNNSKMERIQASHEVISKFQSPKQRFLQSRPTLSPSSSNSQTIHFTYALQFNFVGPPAIVIPDFKQAAEIEIQNTLNNIGFDAKFLSSIERTNEFPGSCNIEDFDNFCTHVEASVQVSSVTRFVTPVEVINIIKMFLSKKELRLEEYDATATLTYVLDIEFTYYFSTNVFDKQHYILDSAISNACTKEGFDVINFESKTDKFLGPSFMPKGNQCHKDYVECTYNSGCISIYATDRIPDEEIKMELLKTLKSFMLYRGDVDNMLLTYKSPEILDPNAPSPRPSLISTREPTHRPTSKATVTYDGKIELSYALEYSYDGHAPEILAILIDGIEMKMEEELNLQGYKSKFISSKPKSDRLPGLCKIKDPNIFCTIVETVLHLSSTSKRIIQHEFIQDIQEGLENLRLTDKAVGLDGKLRFVKTLDFTYLYSTIDIDAPFFSYDQIIYEAMLDEGYDIIMFESQLLRLLSESFFPKGSECHEDFVECTINKGIFTLPLSEDNEEEENILRAVASFMKYDNNDNSMLTYKTPEFNDPTASPSISPTKSPFVTSPPTKRIITMDFEYALESSSSRIVNELKSYWALTIKHINTEILVHLSKYVDVESMTSKMLKVCKPDTSELFCAMLKSSVQAAVTSDSEERTLEILTEAWKSFTLDQIITFDTLNINVRLYRFIEFDFSYLITNKYSRKVEYKGIENEIKQFYLSNQDHEILAIHCEEGEMLEDTSSRTNEESCEDRDALCFYRNCIAYAHTMPDLDDELKYEMRFQTKHFLQQQSNETSTYTYRYPELPDNDMYPTPAPSIGIKPPTHLPTTPSPTSKPTIRPTSKPTFKPTSKPTSKPTKRPTKKPTTVPTILTMIPSNLYKKEARLSTLHPTNHVTYPPVSTSLSYSTERVTSFTMQMEGNFPNSVENLSLDQIFCPDCLYYEYFTNTTKSGLSIVFQDGFQFFTSSSRPSITNFDMSVQGSCNENCLLFKCIIEVIDVDTSMPSKMFDFEILHAAEMFYQEKKINEKYEYDYAGPFAISTNRSIMLAGVAQPDKMDTNVIRVFEDATKSFLAPELNKHDIQIVDVQLTEQNLFTRNKVETNANGFAVLKPESRPSLIADLNIFVLFPRPPEKVANIIDTIFDKKSQIYTDDLISTNESYLKTLSSAGLKKNDSPGTDEDSPQIETSPKEENDDSYYNETSSDDSIIIKSSIINTKQRIALGAIPVTVVICGLMMICLHSRGSSDTVYSSLDGTVDYSSAFSYG